MNELFLLSAQRSGSNWLQTCLNQHPNIKINGEIYPSRALYLFEQLKTGDSVSNRLLREKGIFHRIACDSIMLMIMTNLEDNNIKLNSDHRYIGDKSAYSCLKSFRKLAEQLKYIRLLQKYFPSSKKILLIRDVRDVIVSYSKWSINSTQNLLRFNMRSLFLFCRYVYNWCSLHEKWISDMRRDQYSLIVYYKNMKIDFESTMRLIFDFLDLKIDDDFIELLYHDFYDIKSRSYQEENKRRDYSFYRKGIAGEWEHTFKWYHRLLTEKIFKGRIEKILSINMH